MLCSEDWGFPHDSGRPVKKCESLTSEQGIHFFLFITALLIDSLLFTFKIYQYSHRPKCQKLSDFQTSDVQKSSVSIVADWQRAIMSYFQSSDWSMQSRKYC